MVVVVGVLGGCYRHTDYRCAQQDDLEAVCPSYRHARGLSGSLLASPYLWQGPVDGGRKEAEAEEEEERTAVVQDQCCHHGSVGVDGRSSLIRALDRPLH